MATLLQQIEAFLVEFEMSPTAFGTKAMNDPGFVAGLRDGRDPKMSTADRCGAFMERVRKESAADKIATSA